MATLTESFVDLETTRGTMRVHLFIPDGGGRHPGIISYSEIFQATGPIRRTAAALAGEGYLVAVPEVYHEFELPGTVLAYDADGSARGNTLKTEKEIASYDEDTDVLANFLSQHAFCTGKIASFGVCLGGHLAVRAGFHPLVSAVGAFYPTDLHTGNLGLGKCDDTLQRLPEIKASLLLVFGRQDPHIPLDGRRMIHRVLEDAELDFEWHEFNAAHAFLRDEGTRYNPALGRVATSLLTRFLAEKIG
jgi:carboxymethylenebutenolidase